MTFSERLQALPERINALSLRERGLLALAALAVVFLLWDLLIMSTLRERHERVQNQIEQVQSQVRNLTDSIQQAALSQTGGGHPELRQREAALETEIASLRERLATVLGNVSAAEDARLTLAELLAEAPGLELIDLENQPAVPLTGADGAAIPSVFIHRVDVVVEGSHAQVRDYLDRLARLPDGVFLESLNISVVQWPVNRVSLVLYSLAVNEHWLGV